MLSYFSWLVSGLLLLSPSAPQQTAPASDPQAVALLQRSLAAQTNGTSIADVTLSAATTRNAGSEGDSGTATLKALAAGGSRLDLTLASGPLTEIRTTSNGRPAGTWTGPDGVTHAMVAHNQWTPAAWFFPVFAEAQVLSGSGYTVSYVGQESRDSASVQHVRASIPPAGTPDATSSLIQRLSQIEIYLDSSSLLPVAISYDIHSDKDAGLNIPVEVRFSDFRAVNNATVPFHVQQYIQFGLVLDIQVQSATFNSGLTNASLSVR
jgi:hypothetical protein